jgi:guanylate kinase
MTTLFLTLTGPTCSGKTYLHDALRETYGYSRLVSTTTRPPRAGEVEGREYYFITKEQSLIMKEEGLFAEWVSFNGVYYGITDEEMDIKLALGKPILLILTPQGVEIYKEYAQPRGIKVKSVYVETPKKTRIQRLENRFLSSVYYNFDRDAVAAGIHEYTNRLLNEIPKEDAWKSDHNWDLIISGLDVNDAMQQVYTLVAEANDDQH